MQFGTCELCDVVFTSEPHRNDHFEGSKHKKKLARMGQNKNEASAVQPTSRNSNNSSSLLPPPYSTSSGQNQNQITQQYYSQPPVIMMPQIQGMSAAQSSGILAIQSFPTQTTYHPQQMLFSYPQEAQNPQVSCYPPQTQPIQNTINVSISGHPGSGSVIQSGSVSNLQQSTGTQDDAQPLIGRSSPNKRASTVGLPVEKSFTNGTPKEGEFYCQTCSIGCNSKESMNAHLRGNKHIKKAKDAEAAAASGSSDALFCLVCEAPCNSETSLKSHCSGGAHLRNMKTKADQEFEQSPLICSVCKVRCNSKTTMEEHVQAQTHKSNVLNVPASPVQVKMSPQAPVVPESVNSRTCMVCNKVFNAEITLKDHFESVKHQRNANEKTVDFGVKANHLFCDLCKVLFDSEKVFNEHYNGPAHIYNVEKWDEAQLRQRPPCNQNSQRQKSDDRDELITAMCNAVKRCPNGLTIFKEELVETENMVYRRRDAENDDSIEKVMDRLKKSERLIQGNIKYFIEMCKQAHEVIREEQSKTMWRRLLDLSEHFTTN